MYSQFYADGLMLHLPLIALFVFMASFAGVIAWAFWLAPRDRVMVQLDRLASQPLADDEGNHGVA